MLIIQEIHETFRMLPYYW